MGLGSKLRSLRKKFSKKTAIVAAVLVMGIAGGAVAGVKTATAERPDCDNNAVMYCGAYNTSDLRNKYNSNASTRAIFASAPFGISNAAFQNSLGSLQHGSVHKNGNVVVGGRTVATNAITAGRQWMPGSTSLPGANGYSRSPSVSFRQDSLQAFVKFDAQGKFQFAIIKACGNPVTARPTPPPARPNFTIEKKVRIAGSNSEWKEDVAVAPGQKVEYVIGLANTGNVTLTNMRVRDVLPSGVSYVNNSTYMMTSYAGRKNLPNGIVSGGINIGNVPAGGTAFVFFQAVAPPAASPHLRVCDVGRNVLRNRAYAKPVQLPEKGDGADINVCKPTKPDFDIVKKVKVANTNDEFSENVFAAPGTELTFVIGVSNKGNTALRNILVRDVLPAGFSYVPGSAKITTSQGVSNQPISDNLMTSGYTISNLGVGQVAFIFFNAKLPQASNPIVKECEKGKTKLINKANAKPERLPVKEDDASAETCKPREKKPDFEMQKDIRKKGESTWKQDVTVEYGDTVQYRILVRNTGETDLKNVLVKDNRPTGVEYVAGTLRVNGQANGGDLFGTGVTIPEIKRGQTAEITFDAKLQGQPQPCVTKKFRNIASAKPEGLQPKEDDANVDAKCKPTNPKVDIVKKVNKQVIPVSGEFVYTLEVTNTGDVALNNVKVTDPAPEGVNFLSSTPPAGSTVNVTATNFEATIARLNVGQKVTFQINSKVVKEVPGKIVNTACVDAPEIPGNPDDCDSVEIKVPKYECRSLGALSLGELRYRFTPVIIGDVPVTSVTYNFGDGSAPVVRNDANPVEHTFAQTEEAATYTITATVVFNVAGQTKSDTCVAQVQISPIPDEPCPYNPNLPLNDPNCVEPCPYDPKLPKNDPDCQPPVVPEPKPEEPKQPEQPVTFIPKAGMGSMLGGFVGLSSVAYGAATFLQRRKSL